MYILKSKMLRIPILSIITGVILVLNNFFGTMLIARGTTAWTRDMGDKMTLITLVLAITLFVITALLFLRDMTRKEILKSAVIVVIYYILISIISHLIFPVGMPLADSRIPLETRIQMLWALETLRMPLKLYSTIPETLFMITGSFSYLWLVFGFAAPFLYVLFGKRKREEPKLTQNPS